MFYNSTYTYLIHCLCTHTISSLQVVQFMTDAFSVAKTQTQAHIFVLRVLFLAILLGCVCDRIFLGEDVPSDTETIIWSLSRFQILAT
jgi:hypothetical protein